MDSTKQALAEAVSAFISAAVPLLDDERAELLRNCIYSADTDVRVIAQLKAGTIVIEGVNEAEGKCVEIFRVQVEPMCEVRLQ